jgi:multidrug efflux pump subunit AcrA (membrane-fusion protein)
MSFVKLLPALLLIAACGPKPEAAREKEKEAPAIRVSTAAVETRRLPSERILSGTVTARTTGAVSARLPGHIREIRVREGDSVQAGQVIAIVDARDADAAIKQAEAGRDEARAALPEADAAIASATAQAELGRVTFRRMQELKASKSITEQEFDEAQARLRLAESQIKMAEARKFQTRERIRQAEEAVSRAINHTLVAVSTVYVLIFAIAFIGKVKPF